MKQLPILPSVRVLALVLAAAWAPQTWAQASEIDQVRSATSKLINLLIEQGVLTRARAEALLKEIEVPAPAAAARSAQPAPATAQASTAPAAAASAPGTVRVPYVPEFVRKELKEELRTEIQAQGIREGWAGPGVVPPWVRSLRLEGDLRTRLQADRFAAGNAPAISIADTNRNRALTLLNTTEDRTRLRVRARLGLTGTADDNWAGGVRLTTGSLTDPLSSNQTEGTYGNRFTAAFDRAYIRYRYLDQFNAVAGRFGNPWFGTDVMWANDLSFDGLAVQWTPTVGPIKAFLTAAAMPIQEVELSQHDKWLYGLQGGGDWANTGGTLRAKVGLGYYHYAALAGVANAAGSSLNDFTAPTFAQKGNTYFNISSDSARPLLALASDYHVVNLTGLLDLDLVQGKHLVLTGDFARNIGFKASEVSARVGTTVDAKTNAYLMRVAFGDAEVAHRGEWQTYFVYKRVERDAVLDAFTDSDMRLGGTDTKGFVLGASYGVGKNTSATVRWLSGDAISGAPFSVDLLQVDLSLRF
jgi:hypothetical protein